MQYSYLIKHWFNERRQIVKFYKDLYIHYYNSKFNNPYKYKYDSSGRIPKVLHYAWFGKGDKPDLLKRCMETWPKFLPDYEIKVWDESNFPFDLYPFAKKAYDNKKYAMVSDVARLHAIYNEGGIYVDTDCELLKSFNDLLNKDAFACFETPNLVSIGTLGAKKHHPWIALMLLWYKSVDFCDDYAEIANTRILTRIMRMHYGIKPNGNPLELNNGIIIFPRDYFCPNKIDGKWQVTDNTYVIHHFSGLW